jgi:hypothetical protein
MKQTVLREGYNANRSRKFVQNPVILTVLFPRVYLHFCVAMLLRRLRRIKIGENIQAV